MKFLPVLPVLTTLLLLALLSSCDKTSTDPKDPPGGQVDSIALYRSVFTDPARCASCHPSHYEEWQTSMHAYAMTDPVFLTLTEIGQQRSNNQLDQFCVKCHSPFATLLKEVPPGFDPTGLSTLAKAGISCDVCHLVKVPEIRRGESFSKFNLDGVRRASIADPEPNSFHESEFDHAYGFSDICSGCHDLLSPDRSRFLETTNTEWDNSPYVAMGVECQDCHMPAYRGTAAIGGPVRDNVHRHYFVGVDYPLVDFPGKAETIAAVGQLLENSVTLTVSAPGSVAAGDTFSVQVRIKNDRTGHDIPSGSIFERQMWVELIVRNALSGEVYFSSGLLDGNGDLRNHHSEEVVNGIVAEDSALALFNGIPRDDSGQETLFFWEAKSVQRNTIEAFKSAIIRYPLTAPGQPADLEAAVRLRFRSFPPYVFRAIGQEALLPELRIFDMASALQTITVN